MDFAQDLRYLSGLMLSQPIRGVAIGAAILRTFLPSDSWVFWRHASGQEEQQIERNQTTLDNSILPLPPVLLHLLHPEKQLARLTVGQRKRQEDGCSTKAET
jgi:hypothetical protein